VSLGQPVSFYTVLESARRRGEIALGYSIRAQESMAEKQYGVVVNPAKSKAVTFTEADSIVVLAEE
jgi:hypothetical protein